MFVALFPNRGARWRGLLRPRSWRERATHYSLRVPCGPAQDVTFIMAAAPLIIVLEEIFPIMGIILGEG